MTCKLGRSPSRGDLACLERIAERRAAVEASPLADSSEDSVRGYLLTTLDEMEEKLCLHGYRSRRLAAGWQRLETLSSPTPCTATPGGTVS